MSILERGGPAATTGPGGDDVRVEVLETPGLGDRSHVVHDGADAVVVDPQRDVDRVAALLGARGLRLGHVLETHVHNDYVTGGPELARALGAGYVLPAGSGAQLAHDELADGEELVAGTLRVRALHTPGHTAHHTSYAVSGAAGAVRAVLTGGSMLFGSAGRTDLVGAEHTRDLAAAQRRSLRRLVAELPGAARVLPTHGFGSFCSASPTTGSSSTLAEQALTNPALLLEEAEYVESLVAGLAPVPAYYARMAPVNRRGPAPVDLSLPPRATAADLARQLDDGAWVVDLRDRRAFAARHLRGSRSFELSGAFVTHLGWLLPWGAPLVLVGDSTEQVLDARRELARIGVDEVAGAAVDDVEALGAHAGTGSYPVADFAALGDRRAAAARAGSPAPLVLDVRRDDEHALAHLPGATGIPLHELADRMAQVPGTAQEEVWVHCQSGWRASTAASLLARAGRRPVLVDDSFDRARELGLLA